MAQNKAIRVALGSDHGGYSLKERLKGFLDKAGYQIHDCGTHGKEPVDYPEFAQAVASRVAAGEADFGAIVDGAGIGSAMVANKIAGVRAALCYDVSTAGNAREHNNANVLTLGAGLIGASLAEQIVSVFLSTECTAERHLRRVAMIDELDRQRPGGNGHTATAGGRTSAKSTEKEEAMTTALHQISDSDLARIAARVVEKSAGTAAAPQPENASSHTPQPANGAVAASAATDASGSHCGTDMVCRCGMCADRDPATLRKFLDYGVERIGFYDGTGGACVPEDIARCIDHTVLKPDTTEADVIKLCAEAREFQFASVCISPSFVALAARELRASPVRVCTVVGFPSGAHLPEIKGMEARRAIRDGAREIDMVINIGELKSGNDERVYSDIRMVCEACEDGNAISKVIIEAAYLNDDEKIRACELARKARANYVKTSTGFGPHGATAEDVSLMNRVVKGAGIGVKAAGGIRSFADAREMISAGATRIGASAGIKILQEAKDITISN